MNAGSSARLTPSSSPFQPGVAGVVVVPFPSRMRNDQTTVVIETDDPRLRGLKNAAAAFHPGLSWFALRNGSVSSSGQADFRPALPSPALPLQETLSLMRIQSLGDWLCCTVGIELVWLHAGSILCCLIKIDACFMSTAATCSLDRAITCAD